MRPEDLTPPPAVASEPEPGEERRGKRRLVRWVAVTVGIILAVLACWQDPLYAL